MQSRRLKEGELKEACLLIHKAQASWSSASEESLQEISQRIGENLQHKRLWVAIEAGELVGFGGWVPELLSHTPRPKAGPQDAHLLALYAIKPRQGIGQRLHRAIVYEASEQGMRHMRLWTPGEIKATRIFYEKLGYKASGRTLHFKGLERVEYCRVI